MEEMADFFLAVLELDPDAAVLRLRRRASDEAGAQTTVRGCALAGCTCEMPSRSWRKLLTSLDVWALNTSRELSDWAENRKLPSREKARERSRRSCAEWSAAEAAPPEERAEFVRAVLGILHGSLSWYSGRGV